MSADDQPNFLFALTFVRPNQTSYNPHCVAISNKTAVTIGNSETVLNREVSLFQKCPVLHVRSIIVQYLFNTRSSWVFAAIDEYILLSRVSMEVTVNLQVNRRGGGGGGSLYLQLIKSTKLYSQSHANYSGVEMAICTRLSVPLNKFCLILRFYKICTQFRAQHFNTRKNEPKFAKLSMHKQKLAEFYCTVN